MITFPNAKINLGLQILSKRTDGYHNIESCFYPIPWKDTLEIIPSDTFKIKTYGLEIEGKMESNLCYKAYELLKKDFEIPPVEIRLIKAIPMGAGMGGGSADGACMLKLLNEEFQLQISDNQLIEYASKIGSDCPFFIKNTPAIATETGTVLSVFELDLSDYYLVVENPNIHISTEEAYAGITPKQPKKSIREILQLPMEEWKKYLVNDFENSIFPNHPKIEKLKDKMYTEGAIYASMTGSGSTVFGLFKELVNFSEHSKCFKL